jgi:hypothetical protein
MDQEYYRALRLRRNQPTAQLHSLPTATVDRVFSVRLGQRGSVAVCPQHYARLRKPVYAGIEERRPCFFCVNTPWM